MYSETGTATSSSSGAASEGDWSASLRLAGHDYEAGDAADWQALDANGLLPPYQIAVGALVSARGSAAWQAVPWSAWESDTGLVGDVLASAQSWAGG